MNICNKIVVQTFKTILRIDIHFEAQNRFHKNLTIFNENYMKIQYYV